MKTQAQYLHMYKTELKCILKETDGKNKGMIKCKASHTQMLPRVQKSNETVTDICSEVVCFRAGTHTGV